MKPDIAATRTADAILDAQSGFASADRRRGVREHCVGTEKRLTDLEGEVEALKAQVMSLLPNK